MDYLGIVNEAEARRAELIEELRSLDSLIQTAMTLANLSNSRAGSSASLGAQMPKANREIASPANPTREATRQILRERGMRVKTAALLPLLRERGVEVGGKNPVATLSARLSNADEFENSRKDGWWFAGESPPNEHSIFEEPEGGPATETPSDSNDDKGGSHGTALDSDLSIL